MTIIINPDRFKQVESMREDGKYVDVDKFAASLRMAGFSTLYSVRISSLGASLSFDTDQERAAAERTYITCEVNKRLCGR